MIDLSNINLFFPQENDVPIIALNEINLKVNKGDFIILIGANGSGKTSLLKVLACRVTPNSGKYVLQQNDIKNYSSKDLAKKIALVHQDPTAGTVANLSIAQNFALAAMRGQKANLKLALTTDFINKIQHDISTLKLNLESKIHQPISSLSGGQRQALTILMAANLEPDLLLLDEPTSALDPKTADQLMGLTNELIISKNITAVMVTHQLNHALQFGDKIILMRNGSIAKQFSENEKKALNIVNLYNWFT
ncbi:MAG: hypothetical protein RIQ89_2038 [Bacteroidota bacterium]|jgi:putative tryptophan/tyrosine transport system ATP-binding protein